MKGDSFLAERTIGEETREEKEKLLIEGLEFST